MTDEAQRKHSATEIGNYNTKKVICIQRTIQFHISNESERHGTLASTMGHHPRHNWAD